MDRFRWVPYILLAIVGCGLLSLIGYGAWKLLVAVVTAIINQGLPAIISAVVAGIVSWYCLIPFALLVLFIILAYWVNN